MKDMSLAGVNRHLKSDQESRVIQDYGGKMLHPTVISGIDWKSLMKVCFLLEVEFQYDFVTEFLAPLYLYIGSVIKH
jgi:hypothetical protein